MKKTFIAVIGICLLLSACITTMPSKCDTLTEPSLLCQIAQDKGVRLEDVGNILIVANAVAIGEGLYSRKDAARVLKELEVILEDPISYIVFHKAITSRLNKYPGLFEVAMIYLDAMISTSARGQFMYKADQAMLQAWIHDRITGLEAIL